MLSKRIIISFLLVITALLLVSGAFILYKFHLSSSSYSARTEKNVMVKIPPEIKQQMNKDSQIGSISGEVRVPILLYHYVEYISDKKDTIRQSLDITPNIFEQQIVTLKDAGYTFMTARELGQVLDETMQLPKNPILLTFDDGHWDLDTVVLPILKKYNVKATAYIISGFIGGSDFLSEQQLQDVANSNFVEIGAHTVHHISLKGKLLPIVQYEVNTSKAMLEKTLNTSVVSFAYPNGAFDLQAINVVKQAGFSTAVSTIPWIMQSSQNRYFLYRIRPGRRIGQVLLDYLRQSTYRAY